MIEQINKILSEWDPINVGGMNVRLIGGRVENGQVILSSFSRKGL